MCNTFYPKIFEPLRVGSITLRNRIISAPLGSLTDKSITGMGAIIRGTSGSVPGPRSRIVPGPYCFADLTQAQKVREQVVTIKQRGAKAEFELCHVGLYAQVEPGDYAIGPVSFTREDGTPVRGMTEQMMDEVADAFARGARDAKEYGFDMVMLHFGHGWLPTQFLSPHFNKRTDEYGGSFENRIKFPTMIVDRVRNAVGEDYPLDMRISANEWIGDGTDPGEVVKFVASIQDRIDMVHVSCGLERELEAMTRMSSTTYYPHLINVEWARKIKRVVDIPVAVVGAIMSPEEAEDIIERGDADAIVVGRQIIADPFWTDKAREGRSEDIVPCLRCMNCYNMYARDRSHHYGMKSITCCSVNPRYLHEDRVPVHPEPALTKKRVCVVGGGPAGCKAALTAAERGHDVVLMESSNRLGGQLMCSEYDESKVDLRRYRRYLETQVKKANIEVRYNYDALEHTEEIASFDSLIIAVGAEPVELRVPGALEYGLSAIDAYAQQEIIGERVVIVGGGSIGIELAKMLSDQNKQVTVVERTATICANLNEHARTGLLQLINQCDNIRLLTEAECEEISDSAVRVKRLGQTEIIPCDTAIVSIGMKPRRDLANQLFGLVEDTNVIGDSDRVGTVAEATHAGYYAAASL